MSSASSWSRPSTVTQRSVASSRQANITEHDDEDAGDDDEGTAGDDPESPTLEEVLQAEAEVLATELQQAEDEGVDQTVLEEFEQGMEQAAETLVTMREARQQLQSVRKDRGYGKAGGKGGESTFKRGQSNQAETRKASGKHPCFDCGEHSHWAGDPQCKKPGQGLGRKKHDAATKKPMRQVRVTEAEPTGDSSNFSVAHSADVVERALPAHDVLVCEPGKGNETLVGEVFGSEALNLEQALLQSFSQGVSVPKQSLGLPPDKELVGALDSACNRTCAGPDWLRGYLQALKEAPNSIQDLVKMESENENFRFGNNGVVPSLQRWRLPALVGKSIVLFWVSIVPINTLGCLVGRDFLEAVGAVLDFARRTLTCTHIASGLLQLQQMVAGHFMLELLPTSSAGWGPFSQIAGGRWKPVGQDGVVELYFNRVQWLQYRITTRSCSGVKPVEKEHYLVESSLLASHYSFLRSSSDESTSPICRPSQHHRLEHRAPSIGFPATPHYLMEGSRPSSQPVILRWSRLFNRLRDRRQWHDHGIWFWLLQRPGIRFLPCPYPNVKSCGDWAVQVESMKAQKVWPKAHLDRALKLMTPSGLAECLFLRDRVGFHMAYLEDPMVGSILLIKHMKGQKAAIQREALKQTKMEAQRVAQTQEKEEAIRSLVGPRGGLPTLKKDLVSLATLLHQPVGEKDTVEHLKRRFVVLWQRWCPRWRTEMVDLEHLRKLPWCLCRHLGLQVQQVPLLRQARHWNSRWRRWRSVPLSTNVPASDGPHGIDAPSVDRRHSQLMVGSSICASEPSANRSRCCHGARIFRGGDSKDEHRTSSRGLPVWQRVATERDAPRQSEVNVVTTGLEQPSPLTSVADEPGILPGKMKPGIKQMISQAWDRHCRDRVAVSKNRFEVFEVMVAQYEKELQSQMNEVFALEVDFPSPFVTEVYTDTEPVAREARRRGLRAGNSMTLATQWDFHLEEHRRAAKLVLRQTKPYLLVLAFPCGPWSLLMNLNPNVNVEEIRAIAKELVDFAAEMAWEQLASGRHFMLENPLTSSAWQLESLLRLRQSDRVLSVVIDQCQFGLRNADGEFHRKATQIVTSSQCLVSRLLDRRCKGGHVHAPVIGGSKVTSDAGHYPPALAKAIIQGLQDQFNYETSLLYNIVDGAGRYEVLAVEEHPTSALPVDSDGASSEELIADKVVDDDKQTVISPVVRQAVYRLHENTCHRSPQRLARALIACGAPKEAILAAKQLKCSVCAKRKAPRPQRPASLPQTSVVGSKVHIDLLMLEDALRQTYVVVHVTDSVSRFQAASVIRDKSSLSVIRFLMTQWVPLMGRPDTIVADQGREFISHEFALPHRHSMSLAKWHSWEVRCDLESHHRSSGPRTFNHRCWWDEYGTWRLLPTIRISMRRVYRLNRWSLADSKLPLVMFSLEFPSIFLSIKCWRRSQFWHDRPP